MSRWSLFLSLLVLLCLSSQNLLVFCQEEDESEGQSGETSTGAVSNVLEGALQGDVYLIEKGLKQGKESIDVTNDNGWSAALMAVARGDIGTLKKLIEWGIDLNQYNNDQITPIMLAAKQGDREIVDVLLEGNADPSYINDKGESAHSLALDSGRQLVALMIAEACVLRKLHSYDEDAHEVMIDNIKKGAYLNIQSHSGWTPLIYAAEKGNVTAVTELMSLNANANHAESDGWTALHFAATNGHEGVVNALLTGAKFIDADAYTEDGRTPKMMAEEGGHTNIVSMIDEYIAEQMRQDL